MRLTRFVHAVRTSLWVIPLLCVLAGVLIALGTLWLDRRSGYTLISQSVTGTPGDAQTTLSVFASGDGLPDQPRSRCPIPPRPEIGQVADGPTRRRLPDSRRPLPG